MSTHTHTRPPPDALAALAHDRARPAQTRQNAAAALGHATRALAALDTREADLRATLACRPPPRGMDAPAPMSTQGVLEAVLRARSVNTSIWASAPAPPPPQRSASTPIARPRTHMPVLRRASGPAACLRTPASPAQCRWESLQGYCVFGLTCRFAHRTDRSTPHEPATISLHVAASPPSAWPRFSTFARAAQGAGDDGDVLMGGSPIITDAAFPVCPPTLSLPRAQLPLDMISPVELAELRSGKASHDWAVGALVRS